MTLDTERLETDTCGFLSLSDEVVENILSSLHLTDICNLRLCCRTIALRSVQPYFKTFFRSKTLPLCKGPLEDFIQVTRNSGLGCLVQDITIVGQVDDSGKVPTRGRRRTRPHHSALTSTEATTLLSAGFSNITANSNSRSLRFVSLRFCENRSKIPGYGSRDSVEDTRSRWRPIWNCAAVTFHTVISSLEASQLRIEALNCFNNYEEQRCSIACSALEIVLLEVQPSNALGGLKKLSLSFSDAEENTKLNGLRRILELSVNLEQLKLHQFRIGHENLPDTLHFPRRPHNDERGHVAIPPDAEANLARLFQHASEADPFPKSLKNLRLEGVRTTGEDLLRFAKRASLERINLLHVTLVSGRFGPLFDFCSAESGSSIVDLNFNDLKEGVEGALFFEIQDPQGGVVSSVRSRELQRSGSSVQTAIEYTVISPFWEQGSPQLQERIKRERYWYGPL